VYLVDTVAPVSDVDVRLKSAFAVQLQGWRDALDAGVQRVGWKLGVGDAERIGEEIAVGHLTGATMLAPGSAFDSSDVCSLNADAEIALEFGCEVAPDVDERAAREAIVAFATALELVDLGEQHGPAEAIVASNIFHRAVAFSPFRAELPDASVEGRLIVNETVRATAWASTDLTDRVRAAARVLGALGERLQAGDRLITGSVVQVAIDPGDHVVADLGALGRVGITIARKASATT
jgi:2-keto-4-pentenoate hydratase